MCISPGTERHQKFSFCIKRHIAVHHAAETDGSDFFQRDAVGLFHILRHFLITALEAFPDILQRITPDVVHIAVFPVIAALGDGMGILIYQVLP